MVSIQLKAKTTPQPKTIAIEPEVATAKVEETTKNEVVTPQPTTLVKCNPNFIGKLEVGQTKKLSANATFESLDETIATVDASGIVTATGVGETKILVSADGYKTREVVVKTVAAPEPVVEETADEEDAE